MTFKSVKLGNKIYEVDEWGNIKKKRGGGFRKLFADKDGYLKVNVNNPDGPHHNEAIHRVIYRAHVGEIPEGMTVDHIDEDKTHNHVSNFQLMSSTENAIKGNAKNWIVTNPEGEEFEIYNIEKFCRENNLHTSHIKTHSYKGWKARRKDDSD